MAEERLQKILARAGVASRRKAEELIRQGRIQVDGKTVTELGRKFDPARVRITFDGRPVAEEKPVYILLNKPRGYVTTLSDPQGRPIVTDLLHGVSQRLFPVGRLDLDTEGALLLTNDGQLGNYILHPRFEVNKTYEATVRGIPGLAKLRRLEQGLLIDGRKTSPARARIFSLEQDRATIEVIIHEGRKHQVRKMFQAIGHPVLHLRRTAYGRLKLGSLEVGKYRYLKTKDLKKIFSGKIPFTIKNLPA